MNSIALARSRLARPRRLPLPGTAPGAAFGQVVRNEARLARRQPLPVIGSIGLPVVLMIIFGEMPSFHQPSRPSAGSPCSTPTCRSSWCSGSPC